MEIHLNSYGAYLHVRENLFEVVVKNEQGEEVKKQIAAHKITSIFLQPGQVLSTDAIQLALKNNIDIVFLQNNGQPMGRVWHSKLGSTTRIRKCQLVASLGISGVQWTKKWLQAKLDNQAAFIRDLKKHRASMTNQLEAHALAISGFSLNIGSSAHTDMKQAAEQFRGWEGSAGRYYFEALSKALPKEHQFNGRSFRPAQDPFNAFLNYCYGILYSAVEKALIIAGIDPYVGFMHRDDYNQKSMVYDFIEPYRICAEQPVFRLFSAKKVNKSHVYELANGISLNTEGKKLAVEHFNEYFRGKPVLYKGRNCMRDTILQLEAHAFAKELLAADTDENS